MKKKLSFVLAAFMVLSTVTSAAYGISNPLKDYNLYDDTHPSEQPSSDLNSFDLSNAPTSSENQKSDATKTRNQTLRESSQKVFSNPEVKPAWKERVSFYPNPSFDSIVEKYRRSDFAGCMQECESYVNLHPRDTLGYYYLAMCYTKVNDKDNAIKAYEKVISLNDNPMIVKYATNGRNCVMENEEKCYPNVNVPELVYPYADYVNANAGNLTPVDPEELIQRNIKELNEKLSQQEQTGGDGEKTENKGGITLPFGNQDEELDKFINAPYGNGLSPELNTQYKQIQLKKIQDSINNGESSIEKDRRNLQDVKDFDKHKTEADTIKLAYEASTSEWEQLKNDPEFIKNQQDLEQLRMMFGNNDMTSNNNSSDIANMLPYMTEENSKKLSPEALQTIMLQSLMSGFTL